MKVVIVTNISTPYRDPVYRLLNDFEDIESKVFFCSKSEPNRNWNMGSIEFDHVFLSKKTNKFIHFNFNVFRELNKFKPDVILTAGFNPTMLFAWLWSLILFKKHIPFSDANLHSERNLSVFHKLIRSLVYKTSNAFLGASEGAFELYKSYKIPNSKLFKSCLAAENHKFRLNDVSKNYDLMFCGQFTDRKQPLFFCKIAKSISKSKPDLKVLLMGTGPLKEHCIIYLNENNINFTDAGFVQPDDLPNYVNSSRLLLFPTLKDPWGLVANEALASGVPVLISSVAGAAEELVIDGYNGFVFDNYNIDKWSLKVNEILTNTYLENKMSLNATNSVTDFSFSSAAEGIYRAVMFSMIK